MKPTSKSNSEIVLYQTEDGQTRIQCRFEQETVWMTQALMAELFQTTPQNITLHLRAIYAEGELTESATCKDYLQVRSEGGWQIQRSVRGHALIPKVCARADNRRKWVASNTAVAVRCAFMF